MRFGFGLPHAGAAANGPAIIRFAQRAEALGFESLWGGDHLVLPVAGTTQYPYTTDGSFSRPSTEGFLEPYTLLSYVAAATKTIMPAPNMKPKKRKNRLPRRRRRLGSVGLTGAVRSIAN